MIEKTSVSTLDWHKALTTLLGVVLIAIGAGALLYLAIHFVPFLENFAEHPIHTYIVSFDPQEKPIFFGDTAVRFPQEYLRFVAIFVGVLVAHVWISLASSFINAGTSLLSNHRQVDKLVSHLNQVIESKSHTENHNI